MKDYLRILMRVTGTPLLISEGKLNVISENVIMPIIMGESPNKEFTLSAETISARNNNAATGSKNIPANDSYAVIKVFDSLVSKNGTGLSGFTSYESIRFAIDSIVASGQNNILLYVDSPGGEAASLFSLTNYIREQVAAGVNIIGFTDGSATSAAYAILAAARQAYATETSFLASIAAIYMHVDTSKADTTAGKTYTIFRSKAEKALGDSHTPLTDKVKDKITTMLDSIDTAFNNDVLLSRPSLKLSDIVAMKGSEYLAQEALQLNLIDRIVTGIDEALILGLQKNTQPARSSAKATTNLNSGVRMDELEQLKTALATAHAEKITLETELRAAMQLAVEKERANSLAICNAAIALHTPITTVVAHLSKGYTSEVSLEIQTAIAETKGKDSVINPIGLHDSAEPVATTTKLDSATELRGTAKALGLI